jgi:hypothetical protein
MSEMEITKKKMILEDSYDKVRYNVEFTKEGDHIHFMIRESDLFPPFTFENDYTMQEFIEQHKAFKSCDNLDEVLQHLYNLYDQKKVDLMSIGAKEEKYLTFTIWDISAEYDTKLFKAVLKMTKKKDEDLAKLYEIQNEQIQRLIEVKKYTESNIAKENPLSKEILDLLNNCFVQV